MQKAGGAARDASGRFVAGSSQIADAATSAGKAADGGLAQLKGSLSEIASAVPGVSSGMSALGTISEAVAAGPLAAFSVGVGIVTSALGAAGKALDAFEGKQDRVARLDAALAAQGELTSTYRQQLQQLAGEYGRATGQGGLWLEVLTKLSQHGADSENIRRYAEDVKNLSGLLGGDSVRAGQIYGRVIEGNTSLLRRFGLEIDRTKSLTEQLDDISLQLAQRGGGQLAATTNTLSGQFHQLSGAIGGLWSGFGNLLSQSGVVQWSLSALTSAVRALGSVFPSTVAEVDGFKNKLPGTKALVDDLADGMDEAGDSANAAAGGIGRAGEAAAKTKDQFEQATEAAKKLREQQDRFADAKIQQDLARIDAAEQGGQITKADANLRRANVRAQGEQAKYDRETQEQVVIIQAQASKADKARADEVRSAFARSARESDFGDQAGAAGLTPEDAARLAEQGEQQGNNPFTDRAKALRAQAAQAQKDASLVNSGDESGNYNASAVADYEAQAEAALRQAQALEELSAKYGVLKKARDEEAATAKKTAALVKESDAAITDAEQALKVVQLNRGTATIKADVERAKLAEDARKRELEGQQKALEFSIRHADSAGAAAAGQTQFAANQRALNAIQYKGDAAGLAVANATAPLPPGAENAVKLAEEYLKTLDAFVKDHPDITSAQRDTVNRRRRDYENTIAGQAERGDDAELRRVQSFNRSTEDARKDADTFKDHPEQEALSEAQRARQAAAGFGTADPNTVTGNAIAAVKKAADKVEAHGGRDPVDLQGLIAASHSIAETIDRTLVDQKPKASQADLDKAVERMKETERKLQLLTMDVKRNR